jgi:hypothetical protein
MRPGIFVALAVVLSGRLARGADGPLLVVVEAPPTVDADAAEIRRAIGAELHARTIAPMSTPAETPSRALIVAFDHDRIAMSLRANDGTSVARIIPAPAEHAARLRAIAWLAGNLARDQVSPILAERPAEPSAPATLPPLPAASTTTEPPPTDPALPPTVVPPSSPLPSPLSDAGGAIISIRAEPRSRPRPLRWSISGSIGPVIAGYENSPVEVGSPSFFLPVVAWQFDVQRRREDERLVLGGSLEGTQGHNGNPQGPQLIGANIFVGAAWHYRYCALEATIGAGPEAATTFQTDTLTVGNYTEPSPYYSFRFALYAKGTVAAAVPLSDSIEGLVQLGFHVTSSHEESWFAASTIGLRYLLP